ncbi:hypothetical protein [Candidatus Palauibacter sp.]|uniref:hypothetical protein n=1 Tax=Candidatus Palauibacter sp. TaxID=3101350 RepID=UPI003AF2619B
MGIRTVVGLPAAALGTMIGLVLLANAHLYGWPGAVGGVVLAAAGIALGLRCFRGAPSAANPAAAGACPDSGDNRE